MNKSLLILKYFQFSALHLVVALIVTLAVLPRCSIHRVNVQQGNVISPKSLQKLKIGMTRSQIKGLLGSPLIEDPFRRDRWDYVYRMIIGGQGVVQSSHITLLFKGDLLAKVQVNKPPISEKELVKPTLNRAK